MWTSVSPRRQKNNKGEANEIIPTLDTFYDS
jgi:hypothetical protein